jgi:hypothetical protein
MYPSPAGYNDPAPSITAFSYLDPDTIEPQSPVDLFFSLRSDFYILCKSYPSIFAFSRESESMEDTMAPSIYGVDV